MKNWNQSNSYSIESDFQLVMEIVCGQFVHCYKTYPILFNLIPVDRLNFSFEMVFFVFCYYFQIKEAAVRADRKNVLPRDSRSTDAASVDVSIILSDGLGFPTSKDLHQPGTI